MQQGSPDDLVSRAAAVPLTCVIRGHHTQLLITAEELVVTGQFQGIRLRFIDADTSLYRAAAHV